MADAPPERALMTSSLSPINPPQMTGTLLTAVIFVSAGFYPGSENSLLPDHGHSGRPGLPAQEDAVSRHHSASGKLHAGFLAAERYGGQCGGIKRERAAAYSKEAPETDFEAPFRLPVSAALLCGHCPGSALRQAASERNGGKTGAEIAEEAFAEETSEVTTAAGETSEIAEDSEAEAPVGSRETAEEASLSSACSP